MPEEYSNYMSESKYQEQKSKHFCPLHLVIGVTKQDTTLKKHVRGRSAPIVYMNTLWLVSLPQHPTQGSLPMCTPLMLQQKDPNPLLCSLKYWKLGHSWGPLMHMLQQSKGNFTETETGKDTLTQVNKPGIGYVGS